MKIITNYDEDCRFVRASTEFCAIGTAENPTKTPCSSLGHLVVYFKLKYILIGGGGHNNCNYDNWPNFFTKMSLFLEWITNVTKISE